MSINFLFKLQIKILLFYSDNFDFVFIYNIEKKVSILKILKYK